MIVAAVYFIHKLLHWDSVPFGIAPLVIMVCLIGAVQLIFTGIMGEYILNINKRLMHRPLVVEEKRINFD